jgi:tetratricopeptide (TPR) repeat protein
LPDEQKGYKNKDLCKDFMMFRTITVISSLLLLLSGCAASGPPMPQDSSTASVKQAGPSGPREEILNRLMIAEIAGQRNRLDVAIENLLEVARQVDDPAIAERAMRAAEYAKDHASGLEAAERWVELAPDNPDANLSLAVLALRQGRQETALEAARRIIQMDGMASDEKFLTVAGWLGRVGEKQSEAALEVMGALVESHPDNPYAHLAYGNLATLYGEQDIAEGALSRALTLKDDFPRATVAYSQLLAQSGRTDEALERLETALQADPEDEKLRLAYGRLLLNAKRYPEAKKQFSILSEASPYDSDLLYTLALLELDMGQVDEAATHLRRLLELGEREAQAYYYLGKILESRREYTDAIAMYARVRQSQYTLDARIRIAHLTGQLGDVASARKHLRQLRERHPEASVAVRLYLAEAAILNEAARHQAAIDVLTEGLQEAPGNTDLLYSRALTYERVDRIDLLENDLRAVLLREPENADALNALGYTLADRTTRYQEAYDLIRQALKLKPEEPAIIDSMGWVLYRLDRPREAVKYLRRALSLQYNAEIAAHLGEVLWDIGKHEAAREVLEQALEKAPDDRHLLEVKEQLEVQSRPEQ